MNRMCDALRISVSIIGVNQDGQVAGSYDFSRRCALFGQTGDIHIRKPKTHAVKGEAANLVSREAGLLNQLGGQRIAGSGKQKGRMLAEQFLPVSLTATHAD